VCDPYDPYEGDPEYYNSQWWLWDYVGIVNNTAAFIDDPDAPDEYRARVMAKNTALAYVASNIFPGGINFQQLDSRRRYSSPAQNFNSQMDRWARGWNSHMTVTMDWLPAVTSFPGSYVKETGDPVRADYVIFRVEFRMSLVMHRVFTGNPLGADPDVCMFYPIVRMQIYLWMGVRAEFAVPGTHNLVRTWLQVPETIPLKISNRMAERFPEVQADQGGSVRMGTIIYVDAAGREFKPPSTVVWEGDLGFLSNPVTDDHFDWDYYDVHGSSRHEKCKAMGLGMNNCIVGAMQSHPDDVPEKQIWTGQVEFNFPAMEG
jgi:hypothetical protein